MRSARTVLAVWTVWTVWAGALCAAAIALPGCALPGGATLLEDVSERNHVWHLYPSALAGGAAAAPGAAIAVGVCGLSGGNVGCDSDDLVFIVLAGIPGAIVGGVVHIAFFVVGFPLEFIVPRAPRPLAPEDAERRQPAPNAPPVPPPS